MKQNRRTFLRNTALAAGALSLSPCSGGSQTLAGAGNPGPGSGPEMASSSAIRRQFLAPSKKYRPLVRWWWPGNDVTDEELRREIGLLDTAGFGGAEIQAFSYGLSPLKLSPAETQRVNGFATDSFFRHVSVAAEEAESRGMFVDYTFGSGWPFGGGDTITPELSAVELRSSHRSVEGPTAFCEKLQIPSISESLVSTGEDPLKDLPEGWATRLKKRTKLVAVIAIRGRDAHWNNNQTPGVGEVLLASGKLDKDTAVVLTSRLHSDGSLQWDVPPGTWQIFVYCSVPTVQKVLAGAGDGPQLVMDHLNAEAFAAHAERVGNRAIPYLGKFFGNGIRAIFCDSLEVQAQLFWCDDFPAEFRRRRGYDLLPFLPVLDVDSHSEPFGTFVDRPIYEMDDLGPQVRDDYRQTVSELITERFYERFNQWAHDHRLLSRTQAHGAPAEVLRIYGEADIPETEQLYDYGCYDFLKMAASAAHVYGRKIVGSESFVWRNGAYRSTPQKIKVAADELLTAGVNAIVYHGSPYIMPQVPPPGWFPFTGLWENQSYSSQINELDSFWPHLAQLNGYITRLQSISQTGDNVASVALYREDRMHSAEEEPPSPKLNQAMMDAGYNYDHINAESLRHCTVQGNMLQTASKARYQVLVLAWVDALSAETAEKLRDFAAAGLPILVVGQVPARAEGFLQNAQMTRRVQDAMRALRSFHTVRVVANLEEFNAALKASAHPGIQFHGDSLPFIQWKIGRMTIYFVRNESDTRQRLNAGFHAEGKPEAWNPWTGEMTPVACERNRDAWAKVDLELPPYASLLLVFDPEQPAEPATKATATLMVKHVQQIGAGGWTLTATGLMSGSKTVTLQRNLRELFDWSLDSELRGFSGRGTYATTFSAPAADKDSRILIDLGNVKDVAEVQVNGKRVTTLLLSPYQADITEFLRPGTNQLEISVTNALFNSMVLQQPRTFCNGDTDNLTGLMSAGLIGPVQLKVLK